MSGTELLEAIRELALKKFGKRTRAILTGWSIFSTDDLGGIVFELLEASMLPKPHHFHRDEFRNAFEFDEAFPEG